MVAAIPLNLPIRERAAVPENPAMINLLGISSVDKVAKRLVIIPLTHKGIDMERTLYNSWARPSAGFTLVGKVFFAIR